MSDSIETAASRSSAATASSIRRARAGLRRHRRAGDADLRGAGWAWSASFAADRQWFKAGHGFPSCETPLSQSVCAHALAPDGLLVIPDLTADPRTCENTLVTGPPHIGSMPAPVLRTEDGVSFGTLCVIDTEPRPDGLKPDQAFALRALAQQVMAQLELRRAVREREAALAAERQARDALAISEERYRLSSRATNGPDLGLEPADRPDPLGRGPVRALRLRPRRSSRAPIGGTTTIHPEDGDRVRRSVRAAHRGRVAPLERAVPLPGGRTAPTPRCSTVPSSSATRDGTATLMTGVMLDATPAGRGRRASGDAQPGTQATG